MKGERRPRHVDDRVALRPAHPAQDGDVAADPMQLNQMIGGRILEHQVLEFVQLLGKSVHHRVVAIHQPVDQRVGQVVGPAGANRPDSGADPVANRIEESEGAVLKGHQIAAADEHADLREGELAVLQQRGAADHDLVHVVDLALGALRDVGGVFQGHGMDPEHLRHAAQQRLVSHPPDVDPRGVLGMDIGGELLQIFDRILDQMFGRVVEQEDPRGRRVARNREGSGP